MSRVILLFIALHHILIFSKPTFLLPLPVQNATSASNQALQLAVAALVLSVLLPSLAITISTAVLIRQRRGVRKSSPPVVSMELSEGCLPGMRSAGKDSTGQHQRESLSRDRLSVDLLPVVKVASDGGYL
jgi:hypothetical protein